jgi:hypothetical protein
MKSKMTADQFIVLLQGDDGTEHHAVTAGDFRGAVDGVEDFLNFLPEQAVAAIKFVRVRSDEIPALAGSVPALRKAGRLKTRKAG